MDHAVRISEETYQKLLIIKKQTRIPIKYIIEDLLSVKKEKKNDRTQS